MSRWAIRLQLRVCCLLVVTCMLQGGAVRAAQPPSNGRVEKDVDEITSAPGYRWLRQGGTQRAESLPTGNGSGNGTGKFQTGEKPSAPEGCSFEPNFKDWDPPEPDDPDDGCGNSESPDCGCAPDLGNCSCDPLIGNCGACVPSPGVLMPVGYILAGLALALLIFFVVRALILRKSETDTPFETSEEQWDEEDIRMSQIHSVNPQTLLERANEAAAAGDYKKAVGFVYLLSLSALSRAGIVELNQSTTNWNVLRQVKKNNGPEGAIAVIVRHFEDLFFGSRPPTVERYSECRLHLMDTILPLEGGAENGTH